MKLRVPRPQLRRSTRRAPASSINYKRIVIDGHELLVREVLKISDNEIVYVDPQGTIRVWRRRPRRWP